MSLGKFPNFMTGQTRTGHRDKLGHEFDFVIVKMKI